jgi:hypothetical protein
MVRRKLIFGGCFMSKSPDWMPKTYDGVLTMANDWMGIIPSKAAAWGIPADAVSKLGSLTTAAADALAVARNKPTRTTVTTALCRAAFKSLREKMRDIKKRYFLIPPLTEADFASLGLKMPKPPSGTGTPTAQVIVKTFLHGPHEIGVEISFVSGDPQDPANKGFRVWYLVVPPGGEPPATPDDLRKSILVTKKKEVIPLEYGDSGSTIYIAVQVENGEKKGPWGPMVSAVVP